MTVRSLAYRTDLALLRHGGSVVEERAGFAVVRSRAQPYFWWGNFLLLATEPTPEAAAEWVAVFASEFPDAAHVAIGLDLTTRPAVDTFASLGLTLHVDVVLDTTDVRPPPRPNEEATCRLLASDEDWAQAVDLRLAVYPAQDANEPAQDYLRFVTDSVSASRRLVEAGVAIWMGAFLGERLVAQLGLVEAGAGVARFQAVETHPRARGQGLAGTVIHAAAHRAAADLAVGEFVIVADPDEGAIGIYESIGFRRREYQSGWQGLASDRLR